MGRRVTRIVGETEFTSGAVPRQIFHETDASTTNQVWDIAADGETFLMRTRTDADGAGATWLTIERSGTTVDSITLTGTTTAIVGGVTISGDTVIATGKDIQWINSNTQITGTSTQISFDAAGGTVLTMDAGGITLGTSKAIDGTTSVVQQIGGVTVGTWAASTLTLTGDVIMATGKDIQWVNSNTQITGTGSVLGFDVGGASVASISSAGIKDDTTAGPGFLHETSSATNPTLVPDKTELGSGIGGTGNEVSIIGSGVEVITVGDDTLGFYAATPVAKQTVAADAAALQTALVNLGLITAA